MRMLTIATIAAAMLAGAALAQPAPTTQPLTCPEDLDALRAKLRENYAGYLLEVKGEKQRRHDQAFAALSDRARRTTGDACFFVLRDYVHWFEDPHLFVYQNTTLDTSETSRRSQAVATVDMDEAKARDYFARNAARLDPLEGIWYDRRLRVAIVPASGSTSRDGRFVAVVLESDTSLWRPGAIRARFTRRADGAYETEMGTPNHAVQHLRGKVHKHLLLRLSPGMFGKAFPIAPADSGLLDPFDVHRPTLITRAGTIIISIPSHDPTYTRVLDSLIAAHEGDLQNAERLIIDLRGNEGGASFMSNRLLPYLASEGQPAADRLEFRRTVMLASEDQIRYARRMFGSDTLPQIRRLVARMQARIGELVPIYDSLDAPDPVTRDSVVVGPRRVGVLIDRGTVSASEVLVLQALRSSRVTVFGEPTDGALDYQSTSIVWFSPRERRWGLGYPTITANAQLPAGGMRGKGIPPQVKVNLSKVRDAIGYVDGALRITPR